jgi:hypothetical protein
MSNWHYTENGQQKGPVDLEQLKALIAAGTLSLTSLVCELGTTDWVQVGTRSELMSEIQAPLTQQTHDHANQDAHGLTSGFS